MRFLAEATSYDAYAISWASMACTVLAFMIGLAISVTTKSAATLGYALENAVDSISSGLVLWRFWGGGKSVPESVLEEREKRASVGIGIAFILLALTVSTVASVHLAHEKEPEHVSQLVGLSAPSIVIFLVLGIVKYRVGSLVDSPSLKKDGICSLCGAGLSFGMCLGGVLSYDDIDGSWWLDGVIAVAVSVGLLAYGAWTLVKNQELKWWERSFWCTPLSRQTHKLEMSNSIISEVGGDPENDV